MRTSDFSYELPEELIAQHPVEPRDASRLLYLAARAGEDPAQARRQGLIFHDLPRLVGPGDLLVFNDSRVIPARLYGHREGLEHPVEIFLLHPLANGHWACLARPGRRLKPGHKIHFQDRMEGEIVGLLSDGQREVAFSYEGSWDEALERNGEVPLPPYIKAELKDSERYQTVYAREKGSVAAPTAGLHFTKDLIAACRAQGAETTAITLHVGLGTFRPVSEEQIEDHKMHRELCHISEEAARKITQCKAQGGRVIAVGTTACRVLETFGKPDGTIEAQWGESEIFIYPPYDFKLVDSLITNFHLPESTLLMLVSALAGREAILETYRQAVQERYRFFSFGDAMFIDPSGLSYERALAVAREKTTDDPS